MALHVERGRQTSARSQWESAKDGELQVGSGACAMRIGLTGKIKDAEVAFTYRMTHWYFLVYIFRTFDKMTLRNDYVEVGTNGIL